MVGPRHFGGLRLQKYNLQSMALGSLQQGSPDSEGPRQTGAAIPVYQQKQPRLREV